MGEPLVDDEGARALASVVSYLENQGCKRRPRMGPGGFDLLGPDGRVLIYGFEPEAKQNDLKNRARALLAAFESFRWK